MLLFCCTPSDLVYGVPGAENDQIYIGIEAYPAFKKTKGCRWSETTAWSFLPVENIKSWWDDG